MKFKGRSDTCPKSSLNAFPFEIRPLAMYNLLITLLEIFLCLYSTPRTDSKNFHMKFIVWHFSIFGTFPLPFSPSVSTQETPRPTHILPCSLTPDCALLFLTFMPLHKPFLLNEKPFLCFNDQ